MKFTELGLSPNIQKAVAEQGYEIPTPIQAQAIPAVLKGRDVMAAAQTGTGKTAGFTLPMLQLLSSSAKTTSQAKGNAVRALVLTPTRELAAQVGDNVALYSQHMPIKSTVVFGGVKINPQMMRLRGGVDILVATPGRLLDLHQQGAIHFKDLEILVLDEADRMLDMGFIHDIRKILKMLPVKRQTLMFSATFSKDIRELAKSLVNDPIEVSVSAPNSTATRVKQWLCPVDKKQKAALLIHLVESNDWQQVLVFSKTKHGANKLVKQLDAAGLRAMAIHGNKSQNARTKALADFKSGRVRVLVATDIAARGLDINQLPQVVNFDLPQVAEDYVHRIGRTGRAGAEGAAVSLVCADEIDMLREIERLTKNIIQREELVGFEPIHTLPESSLDAKPRSHRTAKSPKKPRRNRPSRHQSSADDSRGQAQKPPAKSGKGPLAKKPGSTPGGKISNNRRRAKPPAGKNSPGGNKGRV
ncbi:DEAD/DEAH box helicase [Gilvimarinus sp. SDUM040013]|uniref:ATP-dependent RNA helicase RhlE n=1 Tax=Gilvimarinus gilvus TaxID=3058038 RepID=A0ABU4RVR1_9GAMM|nr:DEAD/DEAH box helicase [Gilvimarinus sp. SDUM040013]MDO3387258.1 DEAD/DEAH box helicase [Gilvimarinus sp. SDUM040013]MDX6848947.1 DEAD/DEAH box helicase [Gilvimarinus sp. SDUM040013]